MSRRPTTTDDVSKLASRREIDVSSTAIAPYRGDRRRRWLQRYPDAERPASSGATDWSVGTFEGGIRRQRRKNNKNEEREDLTYSRHV